MDCGLSLGAELVLDLAPCVRCGFTLDALEVNVTKLKVLNLFGGPGCGKSTLATGVFSRLKIAGISCEYVSEYAKVLTWECRSEALSDQLYILAKQNRSLARLEGKVEWAISDSPLLLGIHYTQPGYLGGSFEAIVTRLFNGYINHNFFVSRTKKYTREGRIQTEHEADSISESIFWDLQGSHEGGVIPGNSHGIDVLVNYILGEESK